MSRPPATTPSSEPSDTSVADMLNELLRRMYLSAPSDVGAVIADQARRIGARDEMVFDEAAIAERTVMV